MTDLQRQINELEEQTELFQLVVDLQKKQLNDLNYKNVLLEANLQMSLKREGELKQKTDSPPSVHDTSVFENRISELEMDLENFRSDNILKTQELGELKVSFSTQTDELNNNRKIIEELQGKNSELTLVAKNYNRDMDNVREEKRKAEENLNRDINEVLEQKRKLDITNSKLSYEHTKMSNIYQDFLKNSKNNSLRSAVKTLEEQISDVEDVWEEAAAG